MKILAYIFFLITSFRNMLYEKKILSTKKLKDVEIICIGNISVGGTGKTPAVQYFAKELKKLGKKIAIVSRGYKGVRDREPLLVSDGYMVISTVKESGDEAYLHALSLDVPVIVGKNRYDSCVFAKKHFDVDTIILDDGLQHRKLFRDKNIVLIDATNPFGGGYLLPKGLLREDFKKAAERSTEFIVSKSDLVSKKEVYRITNFLKRKFNKNISIAKHSITSLYDVNLQKILLSSLQGKRVLIFSGLANPLNFQKTVAFLGPKFIERIDFKDHHDFTARDISYIKKRAEKLEIDYVVTTEKDIVKLPNINIPNLCVLQITFTMLENNSSVFLGEDNEKRKID